MSVRAKRFWLFWAVMLVVMGIVAMPSPDGVQLVIGGIATVWFFGPLMFVWMRAMIRVVNHTVDSIPMAVQPLPTVDDVRLWFWQNHGREPTMHEIQMAISSAAEEKKGAMIDVAVGAGLFYGATRVARGRPLL